MSSNSRVCCPQCGHQFVIAEATPVTPPPVLSFVGKVMSADKKEVTIAQYLDTPQGFNNTFVGLRVPTKALPKVAANDVLFWALAPLEGPEDNTPNHERVVEPIPSGAKVAGRLIRAVGTGNNLAFYSLEEFEHHDNVFVARENVTDEWPETAVITVFPKWNKLRERWQLAGKFATA